MVEVVVVVEEAEEAVVAEAAEEAVVVEAVEVEAVVVEVGLAGPSSSHRHWRNLGVLQVRPRTNVRQAGRAKRGADFAR
jgi:hypothetical protein